MKKMIQWVLVATLTCGASVFTACVSSDDNPVSPDETQPSVGFSVRSLGWTEYSIDDETISDEAFEVVVPVGSSFYFKTLKVRYLDKYSGMSISEMASALILDEAEETGQMPQFVQGSQTCYGRARMNGDYVAYVFETSPDGTPTGRYAKCDFTVTESDLGAYYTGPMERRTDWTLSFIGEPYERDLYGSTHTYIDIELNLTNLVPNDGNITESGGKYYYRATSKGTKTLNFKTAGSQTASVSVELIHGDFVPATGSQTTRQYLNIAAGRITNTGPNNSLRQNRNTVNIYSNSSMTNLVASYTTNTGSWSSYNSATNYTAANFASNIVDADKKLTLSMYSNYNRTTYYASTTAGALYNNGGNSTVTFSTTAPGQRTVTVNTTNSYFTTAQPSSNTFDNLVTVSFSRLSGTNNGYVTVYSGSTVTVSVPSGYHISNMSFTFTSENRYPSVTITSGGGTYTGTTTGTWTAANDSTTNVVLTMTQINSGVRMSSIVLTVVDDD